ncbi:hypothetical protein OG897_22020 [Streptomyces sp. NBC_00237]|uniref:hypothetical protein n=1 Tax=Streptomyces sp. NBC_00237 TaxID=2975687 RepID=UPI00224F9F7B|nr:hypothetical protein [Streptomyces sp. NBC_00237]MCX5204115.1 hypothetical protein [Streptomyces sp. NBC_00237]
MRGDEAQATAGGGAEARVRSGPRHAAPKKSLLTKFHMPAGKALALAAMPTAVFVGLSLTPKLAMAAEEPGNPFVPGPCVTQPDEAGQGADKADKPDKADGAEKPDKDGDGKPDADKGDETGKGDKPDPAKPDPAKPDPAGPDATKPKPDPAGTPAPDATKPPADPADGAEKKAPDAPAPAPTPSETETKNPLDPLGVGPAIKDFFEGLGGKKEEPAPPAEAPAKPDADAAKDAEAPADAAKKPAADVAAPKPAPTADKAAQVKDAKDAKAAEDKAAEDEAKEKLDKEAKAAKEAKEKADAATAKTEKAIKAAAEKLGIKVEDFDKDGDGKPDLVPNEDGLIPFPCPTADPDALANAKLEPGIPDLPDDPWILETSMLTLRGLDYAGVVEVRTAGGKIKKVLKFTAKETDIKDLHQTTVGPGGTTGHVQARKGSTSTLRQGTVTMYTEELKGNLFGLIPVTFSPQTPPPLNVPIAMFTKVKVTQAGQFGGTLTVPGLHNYFTGPGTGQAAAN